MEATLVLIPSISLAYTVEGTVAPLTKIFLLALVDMTATDTRIPVLIEPQAILAIHPRQLLSYPRTIDHLRLPIGQVVASLLKDTVQYL